MKPTKELFQLGERVYLDGANHGPLPRRSIAAAQEALEWKRDPSILDDTRYFTIPDRIRAAAAKLFGSAPTDVAVGTGASHGIGLVAGGLDWRDGDHVVIPGREFPANYLPWLALRDRGVEVAVVDPDRVIDAIGPRTRVVSVGHVNFANGRRLDIDAIGAACAERDVLFVVDASQSLGTMPFDARRCGAAVVAVAGYKWLLSPYGTGVTFVHPDWVERLPVRTFNWATVAGAEDFNRLLDLTPRHRLGAVRFDLPETAAFINGMAMAASLELLAETGTAAIRAHTLGLIDRLVDALPPGYGVESPMDAPSRSSIVRVVGPTPEDTAAAHRRCREHGVAVSLRENGMRVAPGIWNDPTDVDAFLELLR